MVLLAQSITKQMNNLYVYITKNVKYGFYLAVTEKYD